MKNWSIFILLGIFCCCKSQKLLIGHNLYLLKKISDNNSTIGIIQPFIKTALVDFNTIYNMQKYLFDADIIKIKETTEFF
jgi:hypothetical protein